MFRSARYRIGAGIKSLILGCIAGALGGCDTYIVQPTIADDDGCLWECPSWTEYDMTPSSAHILLGDTASFHTYSSVRELMSLWTVAGDAAVAETFDGVKEPANPWASRIVVRGIARGSSAITAVKLGDQSRIDTARVFVADSSEITVVDMSQAGYEYIADTLRSGGRQELHARLRDARGTEFRGSADWSVSDTAVLALEEGIYKDQTSRFVRAKNAGTAEVRARFLNVTGVVRFTVVP